MYQLLLGTHIVAGNLALLAAIGAIVARKGGAAHLWAGRAFTLGMTVIFVTAVPMTLIRPNVFLLLVALFNGYLAWSGWLRVRNRSGEPRPVEWLVASAMVVTAVGMVIGGGLMLFRGNSMGVVLVVFAAIGGGLAVSDVQGLRVQRYRGARRIASHLTRMLGATIGAFTAFLVVNVRIEPAFAVWVAPSLVLTPLIAYWGRRVRGQQPRHADPAPPSLAPGTLRS